MSWLHRSRARVVPTAKSSRDTQGDGPDPVEGTAAQATDASVPAASVPAVTVPAATVTAASAPVVEDGAPGDAPEVMRYLPTITQGRAGRYSVTDETGQQVGVIYGDYVVGFTVSCWSLHGWYADMDEVMTALALEARSRGATGLATAS